MNREGGKEALNLEDSESLIADSSTSVDECDVNTPVLGFQEAPVPEDV